MPDANYVIAFFRRSSQFCSIFSSSLSWTTDKRFQNVTGILISISFESLGAGMDDKSS